LEGKEGRFRAVPQAVPNVVKEQLAVVRKIKNKNKNFVLEMNKKGQNIKYKKYKIMMTWNNVNHIRFLL